MNRSVLLFAILALAACQKEDPAPTPTGGGTPNAWTPPTASYWKINGVDNGSSMDAVSVSTTGNDMSLAKPFPALGFGYCQLRVFSNNNSLNIRDSVPEGGHIALPITIHSTSTNDSIRVELDVEDSNSGTQGNYFYRAIGGKLYISKSGGKLRYTSDGTLAMEGVKYPDMQSYIYTCQLSFSQVQP
ncbi:MAG: hypothetical protein IT228_04480 [Flavobacteriales bacterium]|nr:hypothetical protein [Flavobacteriales bacterium]MCC6576580.1 hypothetical protein [Flavobacteriales bacterium]NUQ15700.1 hypothetical protein [Flavobacteriales bacterium]